jgi:2-polyprenyl-3-methyl-5-hydroxy-6-metoxy-1,4-benzoquinol methylase
MHEMTNREVIAAWSAATDHVDDFGEEGDFARRHLLNPAIFALLGDVNGKQVLDAGCGQGYLCRLLARKGAVVTGVEPAESWYQHAVQREQGERLGITYVQEDLSTLTGFHDAFDDVVANMVLMDIPDYEAAIHNCIAALKPRGSLVFSIAHPCFEESSSEWVRKGYVEVREYLHEYATKQSFGYLFHRPLSSYINLVIREGCVLRQIVEPQLRREFAQPGTAHERNAHVPSFLLVHATKI